MAQGSNAGSATAEAQVISALGASASSSVKWVRREPHEVVLRRQEGHEADPPARCPDVLHAREMATIMTNLISLGSNLVFP